MTLLIMAAGMGSRFGGVKQIEPVGLRDEIIMDYSIYDAVNAGFDKVVFVIRRDIEKDFCERIFNRIKDVVEAHYVFQDLTDLPAGFANPEGRTKPWGTTQAVLAARNVIDGPFCVINADDFYGPRAYVEIANFFAAPKAAGHVIQTAMVGYKLCNTVSDSGKVNRGVCRVDAKHMVTEIIECMDVGRNGAKFYYDDNGSTRPLERNADVSMTFFGLVPAIMPHLEKKFTDFLKTSHTNPKAEYPLPVAICDLLNDGVISLKMLASSDQWLGVTYAADKHFVKSEIAKMIKSRVYPSPLWPLMEIDFQDVPLAQLK